MCIMFIIQGISLIPLLVSDHREAVLTSSKLETGELYTHKRK